MDSQSLYIGIIIVFGVPLIILSHRCIIASATTELTMASIYTPVRTFAHAHLVEYIVPALARVVAAT